MLIDHIVVAPHPDDEVLGCSRALASGRCLVVHASHGVPPWIVGGDRERVRSRRISESEKAWRVLGADVRGLESLELADLGVTDAVDELTSALVRIVAAHPDADVHVPAYQRGHPDHDAVYVAALLARHEMRRHPVPAGRPASNPASSGSANRWFAYGLYGLDPEGSTAYGVLAEPYFDSVQRAFGSPDDLARKHASLRAFASQLRPESIVQFWLDHPVAEAFAPLPPIERPLPHLAAYYVEGMDLTSQGVVLDDRPDHDLRARLVRALAAA